MSELQDGDFDSRLAGSEGGSQVAPWRKNIPGRGTAPRKAHRVGCACMWTRSACPRHSGKLYYINWHSGGEQSPAECFVICYKDRSFSPSTIGVSGRSYNSLKVCNYHSISFLPNDSQSLLTSHLARAPSMEYMQYCIISKGQIYSPIV